MWVELLPIYYEQELGGLSEVNEMNSWVEKKLSASTGREETESRGWEEIWGERFWKEEEEVWITAKRNDISLREEEQTESKKMESNEIGIEK